MAAATGYAHAGRANMSTEDTGTPRQPKDWELIEKDWRAGIKSKAQMAAEHGVSRAAMDKRFARLGVSRDLGGKIRSKAESLVSQSVVPVADPAQAAASERDIVEANAALQSTIILSHRRDIQRSRALSLKLLEELEQQTDNPDLLEQLAAALYDPDDKGMSKRLELFDKVISLGSRASTMKTLADALRNLVAMERQAFGLDEKKEDDVDTGVEAVIRRVRAKHGGD
jgi:hypothetical protein